MSAILETTEEKPYVPFADLMAFLDRDTERIKGAINKGYEVSFGNPVIFEEITFLTCRICFGMPHDIFKKNYNRFSQDIVNSIEILRTSGAVLRCVKIELIRPERDCGITGSMFHFKLTFEKRIL